MSEAVLARCRAGEISPQIALSQMVIGHSLPASAALSAIAANEPAGSPLVALAALADEQRDRLDELVRVRATGIDPIGDDPIAATAALFDRLALSAPEAAVAFYSLGDPGLLDEATAELVAVIRAWAPVAGADVLDLGCGIGRVALALAGEARSVLGIDLSAGMVDEAQRRAAGLDGVRFEQGNGRDLAGVADASLDLVLAVDSFPFVVRADLVEQHLAETARVLRPGGTLLVFNWSYRGSLDEDIADAHRLGAAAGLDVVRAGEMPFRIWDASGFALVRRA